MKWSNYKYNPFTKSFKGKKMETIPIAIAIVFGLAMFVYLNW